VAAGPRTGRILQVTFARATGRRRWAAKFAEAGYTACDIVRPKIWTDPRVTPWYRQNILVFARGRVFDGGMTQLDFVHPEMWEDPGLLLTRAPEALATLLGRKLRHLAPPGNR
jgi:hypothetical protein